MSPQEGTMRQGDTTHREHTILADTITGRTEVGSE